MKLIHSVYLFFVLLAILCAGILAYSTGPDKMVIGTWQEVSWEYEKISLGKNETEAPDDLLKDEIYRNLVIHKAEVWEFDEGNNLILYENGRIKKKLKWHIKGRGHILELQSQEKGAEDYQVQEINNETMVIHFSFDLQVRGIVKMTFKKSDRPAYAQKI